MDAATPRPIARLAAKSSRLLTKRSPRTEPIASRPRTDDDDLERRFCPHVLYRTVAPRYPVCLSLENQGPN